jgi:hypothetical protein
VLVAKKKGQAVSNRALSEAQTMKRRKAGTHPQEPVKIDSSRVERAMEVINRVLDGIVLGD